MSENQPGIVWAERSESISKIVPAYIKFRSEVKPAKKTSDNPFFKSKYADLEAVDDAVTKALTANGLAVLQEPGPVIDGKITLSSTLLHESGEYMRSTMTLQVAKADAQGCGSGITYARRYALQSIAGIPSVDDDGNVAAGQGTQPQPPQRPARRPNTPAPAPQAPAGPVYYSTDSLPAERIEEAAMWLEGAGAKRIRPGLYTAPKKIGPYNKTDRLLVPKPTDLTQKEEMDAMFDGDNVPGAGL